MRNAMLPMAAWALVMSLSACGRPEEPANEVLVANDMNVTIEAENVVVVNDVGPAKEIARQPAAESAPAPPAQRRPPPPAGEAEPKEPAADPHAGHDMSNMN